MLSALFSNVFLYRDFIIYSIRRDFQSRYQSRCLGILWLVLQPLAMILVYTLVFSSLMRTRMPDMSNPFSYSIYLCSGMLPWGFFTEMLNGLVNVFLNNASILKKLNFPRICLPIIVSISSVINFFIIFIMFALFMIISDNFPGWIFFAIFPVLLVQMVFTVGIGIIFGIINVFIRDVGQIVVILLQFWFWCTPIVYTVRTLPEWAYTTIYFNPMTILVESYQSILLYHCMPDWLALALVMFIALTFFIISWWMFYKNIADIMDEI